MELPPLSAEDLKQPDEKLGWWLVSTWIGHHAQRAGFALDAIPPEWATRLVEETAKMDSESVANAPLESAFRKACGGDMAAAGRMLRAYVHSGAVAMVNEKYAAVGIKQTVGRKKGGKKAAAVNKAVAAPWHASCAEKARALLEQGKSPRELTGMLATQFQRDVTTIRRVLKKAGVK
ncbi:hypothetical protein [Rhodanobacter terrae]|uniref:Uncharacterized protein n=1 Tax=Rhodanobacter terrae TaxID=418647 RepID=A0ABW0T1X9_9GAMM